VKAKHFEVLSNVEADSYLSFTITGSCTISMRNRISDQIRHELQLLPLTNPLNTSFFT